MRRIAGQIDAEAATVRAALPTNTAVLNACTVAQLRVFSAQALTVHAVSGRTDAAAIATVVAIGVEAGTVGIEAERLIYVTDAGGVLALATTRQNSPQSPQLEGSLVTSVHPPSQRVNPSSQTQAPATQVPIPQEV